MAHVHTQKSHRAYLDVAGGMTDTSLPAELGLTLRRWYDKHSIVWSGVEFKASAECGMFVVARQALHSDSVIAAIPKEMLLSRVNAAQSAELHGLLDEGLPSVEVVVVVIVGVVYRKG